MSSKRVLKKIKECVDDELVFDDGQRAGVPPLYMLAAPMLAFPWAMPLSESYPMILG